MSAAAVAPTLVDQALLPLRQALAAMAIRPGQPPLSGLSPELSVTNEPGWAWATSLVNGERLDDLLDTARTRWRVPAHVAATLAFKSYSYWLALPAVIGYAAARRVPLLRPESVRVRWSVRAPFVRLGLGSVELAILESDPLAFGDRAQLAANGIRVVRDEHTLLTELRLSLMDDHLAPIVAQLRDRVHVGSHTLWGSLAAGIGHGLSRGSDVVVGSALETAQRVVTALGVDDLVDLGPAPGGLTIARKTCCLAFKLPEPKVCTGCCIK